MATIALFGTRMFGLAAAEALTAHGHTLAAVVSPHGDPLYWWAHRTGTPHTDAATYTHQACPTVDVIVAAHSHAFIGRKTRARATYSIGYHPSLLPLHRGRDAIRWTIRDADRVTGGTVYHLTDNIDAGPIAAQRHVLVPPNSTPGSLWREALFPLGLELLTAVCDAADAGSVAYYPQNEALATWEPSWDRPPLLRPELPELGPS